MAPHAMLRPFCVNRPVGRYLGRRARFSFRASSDVAVNLETKPKSSKTTGKKKKAEETRLEVLYDDGFGSVTMKDLLGGGERHAQGRRRATSLVLPRRVRAAGG